MKRDLARYRNNWCCKYYFRRKTNYII